MKGIIAMTKRSKKTLFNIIINNLFFIVLTIYAFKSLSRVDSVMVNNYLNFSLEDGFKQNTIEFVVLFLLVVFIISYINTLISFGTYIFNILKVILFYGRVDKKLKEKDLFVEDSYKKDIHIFKYGDILKNIESLDSISYLVQDGISRK